jgi:hypothetical protein
METMEERQVEMSNDIEKNSKKIWKKPKLNN